MAGEKLEKLLAERKALDARIQQEKNRENERKRKDETRRKILAGAVVLDEAEKHPTYKAELFALLGRFLVRPADRVLFGLEPLPEGKGEKPAPLRNGLVSLEGAKSEN